MDAAEDNTSAGLTANPPAHPDGKSELYLSDKSETASNHFPSRNCSAWSRCAQANETEFAESVGS